MGGINNATLAKQILLILNNIWGSIDFKKLGIPFENECKGLKLLLTIRNHDVLTNVVDSQSNAWNLFKSIAGTLQVAKECRGMPVATFSDSKRFAMHDVVYDVVRSIASKNQHVFTVIDVVIPMSKGLLSPKLERYKAFIGVKWFDGWYWKFHSKTSRMLKLSLDTNEDGTISKLKGIKELELGELLGARSLLDDLDRNDFSTLKHLIDHSNSHCLESASCGALPSLEPLIVGKMDGLEKICNRPLGAESSSQLRTIKNNVEEIFPIGGQEDGNNIEVVPEIKFSQLRILTLVNLPWLKSFYCKVKTTSSLQLTSNTRAREIIYEEKLNIPSSIRYVQVQFILISYLLNVYFFHSNKQLLSLESLNVFHYGSLEEIFDLQRIIFEEGNSIAATQSRELLKCLFATSIVAKEEVLAKERPARFRFPKLTSLKLNKLPELRNFYPSNHTVEGLVLKKIFFIQFQLSPLICFVLLQNTRRMQISTRDNNASSINSKHMLAIARYSASADDLETLACFLDFHDMRELPRKIQKYFKFPRSLIRKHLCCIRNIHVHLVKSSTMVRKNRAPECV
ncbi:hypothetical protein ACOSP7_014726 [Xanthoceras sorbifolium]